MAPTIDYKSSGVDIDAGDRLVDWLQAQPLTQGLGGFAALFNHDFSQYKKPQLVACTDGVGTKVKWAVELDRYEPVGIDLVAMCVNDLITCGADPLFFLDYYASAKLESGKAQRFLSGILTGLKQSDCVLIGGETAEMPGIYQPGDFDAAGFSVGVVDQAAIIDGKALTAGDVAVGIASSGFHSNGYSLLRKVFDQRQAEDKKDLLMEPTRIYVEFVKKLRSLVKIKGMAHITGGGIVGNAPRVIPPGLALKLIRWPIPDLFLEVKEKAGLTIPQLLETFNCGVGYVVYVSKKDSDVVLREAKNRGWASWIIGQLISHSGEPEVLI